MNILPDSSDQFATPILALQTASNSRDLLKDFVGTLYFVLC